MPFVAEHLDAVVHTAGPVPAALDHPHSTVFELDERDRFVFTRRALSVDLRRHLRVDTLDPWLTEEPPAEGDPVTPQVHEAPPPDCSTSQNHSECGPECFSPCFTRCTRPKAPSSASCFAFTYLGAKNSSSA